MVYWVFQCFVIVKFMTNYDDFSNAMKQIHQKISEKMSNKIAVYWGLKRCQIISLSFAQIFSS